MGRRDGPPHPRGLVIRSGEQRALHHTRGEQIRLDRARLDAEIELALSVVGEQLASLGYQEPELDIAMGRAHVRNDLAATTDVLGDLDRSRARGRPDVVSTPPHETRALLSA